MNRLIILIALLTPFSVAAQEIINIYGPGGPAPAIKEVAKHFQDTYGISVNITSGPQNTWKTKALKNADLIFSGSEIMLHSMKKEFDLSHNTALYMRPVTILVRKGNPQKIKGIDSLLSKDVRIIVVNGAGQSGLWEDVIGRTGKISDINNINSKIAFYANNSAEALRKWQEDSTIDAWIIWNHWHNNIKDTTDQIPVEEKYRIYRPVSIAYTRSGINKENVKKFVDYLSGNQARFVFNSYGWKVSWDTSE